MAINWNDVTAEGLNKEAAALEYVAREVYPAVCEVIAKFDGKQCNKRFFNALMQIPGVLPSEVYFSRNTLRVEVYYSPAYYERDTCPGLYLERQLGVCFVEANGPSRNDRVDAATLHNWTASSEADAAALRDLAAGTCEAVTAFNEALEAANAAYDAMPSIITNALNVQKPAWRCYPVEVKR